MMASLKDLNYNIKNDHDISCYEKVITDLFLSKNLIKQLKCIVFDF